MKLAINSRSKEHRWWLVGVLVPIVIAILAATLPGQKHALETSAETQLSEALGAYRSAIARYNRRKESKYYTAFTQPIECFYNKTSVDIRSVRPAPFRGANTITGTTVLSNTPREVIFRHHGLAPNGVNDTHSKVIVMKQVDSEWKIAVEVGRNAHRCFPQYFD